MKNLITAILIGIGFVIGAQYLACNASQIDASMKSMNSRHYYSFTDDISNRLSAKLEGKGVFSQSTTEMLRSGKSGNWNF